MHLRAPARAALLARDEPCLACASSWKKSDPHARQALGKDPLLFSSAEHIEAVMDLSKAESLATASKVPDKRVRALVPN